MISLPMQLGQVTSSKKVEKLPLEAPIGSLCTGKVPHEGARLASYRTGTGIPARETCCVVGMDNRCPLSRKRSGDISIGYHLLSIAGDLVLPILPNTAQSARLNESTNALLAP